MPAPTRTKRAIDANSKRAKPRNQGLGKPRDLPSIPRWRGLGQRVRRGSAT